MITEIDLEISSHCNAACHLCVRTFIGVPNPIIMSLEQVQHYFRDYPLQGQIMQMCGVLGEAAANPNCIPIVEWLLQQGVAEIQLHSNMGLRTKDWWEELGFISAAYKHRLIVYVSIDGVTKNDYRVGVNLKKAWTNVDAYLEAGGLARWHYIVFDYNRDEIELARTIAKEKGIKFVPRETKKNETHYNLTKEQLAANSPWKEYTQEQYDSIKCKHKHVSFLKISVDGRLWPCAFLYDEYYRKSGRLDPVMKKYGDDFNKLDKSSIPEMLQHEWYKVELEKSFNPNHPLCIDRCFRACGDHGDRLVKRYEGV